MSSSAAEESKEKSGGGEGQGGGSKGNILIHHSRDTAEKQWAETRVLTLAGVARVFNTKRRILQHLGESGSVGGLLELMVMIRL